MSGEKDGQAPDRKCQFEGAVTKNGWQLAASPNEKQAGGGRPEWRGGPENRRGELICRYRAQGQSQDKQKKAVNREAP